MKTVAIVQARMTSLRFPGKVMEKIHGQSLVALIHKRLALCSSIDSHVFAISTHPADDILHAELEALGALVFRGDLHDVQKRFIECAKLHSTDLIVRITGDCPIIDPELVDEVVAQYLTTGVEYCSNSNPPTFPDGLDVEVFSLNTLMRSRSNELTASGAEHVTHDIKMSTSLSKSNFTGSPDFSSERWTVDYKDDLVQLNNKLPKGFEEMSWREIRESGFVGIESSVERNEGSSMGTGQKLWNRAKSIIPGGSMLLSKRSEMYHPELWPSYYSRAKGIEVTDLDGNVYLDFSTMSVGACSLGYGNDAVDQAVKEAVDDGVMSSLNSPAEVELAETLLQMHPWAGMARFARSGGEANAIAIRIARAHSGKDKVAICGYHGWHDWYLSANLSSDSSLDGHLLPGLAPNGVPRSLAGTVSPFEYNNISSLEGLLSGGEYGVVKMEVSRNKGPEEGFLTAVRELCDHHGAVLIFDECTSGFRETFGGLHLKYEVEPDLAMFGKALGNGYAITAVIGRSEVMQAAQDTFISSTFWTERLGPVAAVATLKEMKNQKSWETITSTGGLVKAHWIRTLDEFGLPYTVSGLDSLATFAIDHPDWILIKTVFTQKMLEKGFLASSGFNASTQHDTTSLNRYFKAFDEVLTDISLALNDETLHDQLTGHLAQVGFKRLN